MSISELKQSHLRILRDELKRAEERQRRWSELGHQMGKTEDELWKAVGNSRKAEVESLKLMVKRSESA